MQSKFGIAVSSEVMAILAVFNDGGPQERMQEIGGGLRQEGQPCYHRRPRSGGRHDRLDPASHQPQPSATVEGQPCFVHAGPFANIAVGQSSMVADQIGLKLSDYHITDPALAPTSALRSSGTSSAGSATFPRAVIMTTIRGLKHHGGNAYGRPCPPGKPFTKEYFPA